MFVKVSAGLNVAGRVMGGRSAGENVAVPTQAQLVLVPMLVRRSAFGPSR